MRQFVTTFVLLFAVSGCKDSGEPFLVFDKLCESQAEVICAARASCDCAAGEDEDACREREEDACEAVRDRIAEETALAYDSESAARVRDTQQIALDDCEAPLPLVRFFEGGLPEGEPCSRDAECETGHCGEETSLCEIVEAEPLCSSE